MATKDEEIEILNAQLEVANKKLIAVGIEEKKSGHAVIPTKPINEMSVLDYDEWRLKELNAKLLQCVKYPPAKRANQEKEYKRLIINHESKFIADFETTNKIDSGYAKKFSKDYDAYIKKLSTSHKPKLPI